MNIIFQIILVIVTTLAGYFIFKETFLSAVWALMGAVCGLVLGYVIIKTEDKLKNVSLKIIIGSLMGITISLLVTNLFISNLLLALMKDIPITVPIYILIYVATGYLGFKIGMEKSKTLDLSKVPLFDRLQDNEGAKILDTSTIIDGRIVEICETGFLEGTFIIPQFVLYEIQHIADHQDTVKRTRGRRGLDILHRLQKQTFVKVKIIDYDFPKLKDVDSKLIALAKRMTAKIVTNDYNLNKVAELQGIDVLNINQLATALRPPMLPGEQMNIKILKEGKEHGQGIGYLDDGTMIVVDDARKLLGKPADVVVTSVLQTTSGRMIFARLKEDSEKDIYFPGEYQHVEEQVS